MASGCCCLEEEVEGDEEEGERERADEERRVALGAILAGGGGSTSEEEGEEEEGQEEELRQVAASCYSVGLRDQANEVFTHDMRLEPLGPRQFGIPVDRDVCQPRDVHTGISSFNGSGMVQNTWGTSRATVLSAPPFTRTPRMPLPWPEAILPIDAIGSP